MGRLSDGNLRTGAVDLSGGDQPAQGTSLIGSPQPYFSHLLLGLAVGLTQQETLDAYTGGPPGQRVGWRRVQSRAEVCVRDYVCIGVLVHMSVRQCLYVFIYM